MHYASGWKQRRRDVVRVEGLTGLPRTPIVRTCANRQTSKARDRRSHCVRRDPRARIRIGEWRASAACPGCPRRCFGQTGRGGQDRALDLRSFLFNPGARLRSGRSGPHRYRHSGSQFSGRSGAWTPAQTPVAPPLSSNAVADKTPAQTVTKPSFIARLIAWLIGKGA